MKDFKISLKGIKKAYQKEVLSGVSLEINRGDFLAVVGKSGSGKSTLMNILGLVEYFDEGEYYFDGTWIDNSVDYAKLRLEKIGLVFQNYNLIPTLTCRENILLPALYASDYAGDFDQLVRRLGIADLINTSVNVLSGGEKQRVAIARALILSPQIIIADEPTGNLDRENKEIVLDLLAGAHDRGCALVIITHDYSVARLAGRILELKGGLLHEKI
jgi:ABC-type lipoprotein export system ATPase subunit